MSYRKIFLALACAAMAQAAVAQAPTKLEAGFDCANAKSAVEIQICSHAEIAAADRAMSIAYRALLARAPDTEFAAALRRDQQQFVETRELGYHGTDTLQAALDRLLGETELRAEMLNWWNAEPASGLEGNWSNLWGNIKLRRGADGILKVEAEAADQVSGRWLCGYEGSLVEAANGEARGSTLGGDLVLRRKGALLEVPENFCDETGPPAFGSFQGQYFRVGAE